VRVSVASPSDFTGAKYMVSMRTVIGFRPLSATARAAGGTA
jgi:hypothetical protein